MPYYAAPATVEDRLYILEETQKFAAAEQAAGRPVPVTAATLTGAAAFTLIYQPLVSALQKTLGDRSREISEAATARATLELTTRDYIEVLKRRTIRRQHPVAVLIHHGLTESGDVPSLDSWADLQQVATALIAGDAASATAYGPMANPSAAELATALAAAQEEHDDIAPADSTVQAAQNALAAQQEKADFWVSEIRLDALNTARREDPAGQRRLLRKLGYTFKPFPGETPEPADPIAPAATTPTLPSSSTTPPPLPRRKSMMLPSK